MCFSLCLSPCLSLSVCLSLSYLYGNGLLQRIDGILAGWSLQFALRNGRHRITEQGAYTLLRRITYGRQIVATLKG